MDGSWRTSLQWQHMISPQLIEYVQGRLSAHESPDTIREDLRKAGWGEPDIQAAFTPVAATNDASEPSSAPSRPQKRILIVGIILGILVLAGAASAGYVAYVKVNPERIVGEALGGMLAINSVEYTASLRIEATSSATSIGVATARPLLGASNDTKEPVKLLFTVEGAVDRTDRARVKSKTHLTLASTAVMNGSPLFSLGLLQLPDATYASLIDAPSNMFIDLSPIVGVWVKFDPKSFAKQFLSSTATPETARAERSSITEEQLNELKTAYAETRPVQIVKKLSDEVIDGDSSFRFQLRIDKENLKEFLSRAQRIMKAESSLAYEKFNDDYARLMDQADPSIEIWISKKNRLPTRLLLQANLQESSDVPANGTVSLDVRAKNYNQAIIIEAPSESRSFEEVFGSLMTGSASATLELGATTSEGEDTAMPSNL